MTRKSIDPDPGGETASRGVSADPDGRATIRLPSHPTAGYRWQLSDQQQSVVVEKHEVEPGVTFGGAAQEIFHVRLISSDPAEVEMVLKRPWETEPAEIQRLVISPHLEEGSEEEESG